MNKRIKQLAEQAKIEFTYDPTETPMRAFVECWEDDLEKFAELILIEVTDILSTYRGKMVFEDGAEYNYQHPIIAIRKHFGVES